MKVERAGFLVCLAALAGCPRASAPPPRGSDVTEVPVAALDAGAHPDASAGAEPASAPAVALPACLDPEVPPCVDFGVPGPTCEKGMEPGVECVRLRGALRPDAARAAVSCMIERRGTCSVHRSDSAQECFLFSLSSACERPGARAACAPIVAKCGAKLEEEICVAELSAVVDGARDRAVACLGRSCDPRCYESVRAPGVPPPKPKGKAAPGRVAAELARWKPGTEFPAEWTACRLRTDCEVIAGERCGSYAVNHLAAPYVDEMVRREAAKGSTRGATFSCAGPGLPACVAGKCAQGR